MSVQKPLLAASVVFSLHGLGAFHSFMEKYSRAYEKGSDEYHRRLALFAQRSAEADAHNARPDRLWTAGVNRLADRTEEELAQLRGWRGASAGGADAGWRLPSGSSFLSQRSRGRPLPQEVMNWTSLNSAKSIMDQGSCGSCWAVSSVAVLTQHHEIYNPQSKRSFSAQELVSCVPNPHKCGGTGGCEGATIELALHWAMNQGLVQETEVPYRASDAKCKKSLGRSLLEETAKFSENELSLKELTSPGVHSAFAGAPGLSFGMHAWERLPENAYEPLLRAVAERGPVGISVSARPWASYVGGIFDGCSADAVIDHAVVLVGYGKDKKSGTLFYQVQNSWGKDWGEEGHIRLLRTEADEEKCGIDHQPEVGTACTGGPKEVKVCGTCGILYDSAVPHFKSVAP